MDDQISRGTPMGGPPPGTGRPTPGEHIPGEDSPGETAATFAATLADEWATAGVRHAVVAPGSRSTPISVALDAEAGITLHVAHDERVAAFMALGIARATGVPAIVACTSGTAATHFHAAVVEADLAAVPMVVVTADRPPELQGVLAPQTIDQRDLYGKAVRWYCEPGPPAVGSAPWWRDLARDALERCSGNLPGPVHLNLAFREPLAAAPAAIPPSEGAGDPVHRAVPWGIPDEEVARLAASVSKRRGVIVAGARSASGQEEADAVWALADHLRWPVVADGPSGLRQPREGVISAADPILRSSAFRAAYRPEVVLHLGGLPASRAVNEFLGQPGALHIGVDRFGRVPDPGGILAARHPVRPSVLAESLLAAAPDPAEPAWRQGWSAAEAAARAAIEANVRGGAATEPAVALDTLAAVAEGTQVVVSSSMPVRDLEAFGAPRANLTVHSNRGANGIDGVTATAIGVALGSGSPTTLLTGDVAFLHDLGALTALRQRELDLTVVVVDNDGGGIFGFLPQARELPHDRFERLFGTPHGTDLAALVAAFGLPVERVNTRAGHLAALSGAQARGGTRVVVVSTDREDNTAEHERLWEAVAESL